jgi:hypothetical protein
LQNNPERPRLGYRDGRFGVRAPSLLTKVLAVVGGALVLVGAIAVSLVLFAIVLTGVVVFGTYLWWKTRDLRKQLRARADEASIIEGEVIRDPSRDEIRKP